MRPTVLMIETGSFENAMQDPSLVALVDKGWRPAHTAIIAETDENSGESTQYVSFFMFPPASRETLLEVEREQLARVMTEFQTLAASHRSETLEALAGLRRVLMALAFVVALIGASAVSLAWWFV